MEQHQRQEMETLTRQMEEQQEKVSDPARTTGHLVKRRSIENKLAVKQKGRKAAKQKVEIVHIKRK